MSAIVYRSTDLIVSRLYCTRTSNELLLRTVNLKTASPCLTIDPSSIKRYQSSSSNGQNVTKDKKASHEQLLYLENRVVDHAPEFFKTNHIFDIYTNDIIFIDNIRNKRSKGLLVYKLHVNLYKSYSSLRYHSVRLELLSIAKDPDESLLRFRWRLVATPFPLWSLIINIMMKRRFEYELKESWTDHISTMHVNSDGLVHCHVCDNFDVDIDEKSIKQIIKNKFVRKMNLGNLSSRSPQP